MLFQTNITVKIRIISKKQLKIETKYPAKLRQTEVFRKKQKKPEGSSPSGRHRKGGHCFGTSEFRTQPPLFLRRLQENTLKKKPKEKYHAERISTSVDSWWIIAAISSLGEGLANRSTAMKLQGDTVKHFGDCGTKHGLPFLPAMPSFTWMITKTLYNTKTK